jgi:two-component system nitrogen regulation response regulator GlnG/two-component system response regulator HydG
LIETTVTAMREPSSGALDATTLPPSAGTEPGGSRAASELIGLVVLWSRQEPTRIGEALLFSPSDLEPWIFGRGDARPREGARRISLVRHRPGALAETGPVECPRISRAQLRLWPAPAGGLTVENIGACALLRRGREIAGATVAPGELVELRNELLLLCVRRTLGTRPVLAADHSGPSWHPFGQPDAFGVVGESQPIWDLRRRVAEIARQSFHTLILGESGTGKELVAQAIHAQSARASHAMVSRNAATIPEGLADAELFGNVRNYPNSGMPERPGLVGQAHGSTLFLDELAEVPAAVQTRLLRVMDGGEYHRLGEATARTTDLRIVAATNRPASHIKHDVLARLKVRVIVPDLNTRREDVPLIVAHLLRRHASAEPVVARRFFPGGDLRSAPSVSPLLIEALVQHPYTTHVRELEMLLIRAALEGEGKYLEPSPDLRRAIEAAAPAALAPAEVEGMSPLERQRLAMLRRHRFSPTLCARDPAYRGNRQAADLHLRQLVCRALHLSDWQISRAAALLAGPMDQALRARAAARIETFLSNLRQRLAVEPPQKLERTLAAEWRGSLDAVLQLIEALRAGKISERARAGVESE